jgi:hypothetical protein
MSSTNTAAEGFSSDWLSLREPADARARNPDLADRLRERFHAHPDMAITDIGAGTGANLRALAPMLGTRQSWRLVDHDAGLLAAARAALGAWAEGAVETQDGMKLRRDGLHIDVSFVRADLSADLEGLSDAAGRCDLVTASAFFDLVSADWIARFVAWLSAARRPLYTVLSYDGTEIWQPPCEADEPVHAAFVAHQQTDKGFGAAAGPAAIGVLAQSLSRAGYELSTAPSPWRLSAPQDAALIAMLASGIADAAAQTGLVSKPELSTWRQARIGAQACLIGHADLLALPTDA